MPVDLPPRPTTAPLAPGVAGPGAGTGAARLQPDRDQALERLMWSRQRLRDALPRNGSPAARGAAAGRPAGSGAADDAGHGGWRQQPVWHLLGAVLGRWWQDHPLHLAGNLAAQAGGVALRPVARDHPLALVAAAGAAGALLAWLRPWRWRLPPVLLAGLAPQLLREGLALMAGPPLVPPDGAPPGLTPPW